MVAFISKVINKDSFSFLDLCLPVLDTMFPDQVIPMKWNIAVVTGFLWREGWLQQGLTRPIQASKTCQGARIQPPVSPVYCQHKHTAPLA